jgi:DNA (cytosine-5)-methyltransferase 1
MFPYNWSLSNGYPSKGIESNNLTVFGTFICGGGSTMGYKLAGFNHLGGVEIDPQVASVYKENHNPKHLYQMDIRDFNKLNDIPKELYSLDILDGSPPCSSFSTAGTREKDWGVEKVFREGQARQVLDDLFFDYIFLAKKLQPKVVIAENVRGLILGNAKAYVIKIKKGFEEAGYNVQLFLLNAASMGVPQRRERVFFICSRKDLCFSPLQINFNEPPIKFGDICSLSKRVRISDGKYLRLWEKRVKTDNNFGDINKRINGRVSGFGAPLIHKDAVFPTLVSNSHYYAFDDCGIIKNEEYTKVSSFPSDYNFLNVEPKYLMGMSVPPVMTARVANQIYEQWFKNLKQ